MFQIYRGLVDLVHGLVYNASMATVNIHEAKTHFSKLIKRVMSGEEIIIANSDKPVAILSKFGGLDTERKFGVDEGTIVIHPDFDDPLEEFDL